VRETVEEADSRAVPAPEKPTAAATMVGLYTASGEGDVFAPCSTQARYAIAHEGEFEALQRAVAAAPHESTQPIVVSLVGRVRSFPVAEGNPPATTRRRPCAAR
jgi:hypothetical protein